MDIAAYQRLLQTRRAEIETRLVKIEQDFETPRNPDDDDRAVERNNDEVLEGLGHAGEQELRAIDAALARISDGTFGLCTHCGLPIAPGRLAVLPQTPFCENCAAEL